MSGPAIRRHTYGTATANSRPFIGVATSRSVPHGRGDYVRIIRSDGQRGDDYSGYGALLTDMSDADHAIRVVKAALEPLRACPNGIRVHPVQGEFTYVELVRYHTAARELLRIDGVRGSKIDYQLNRLVIYVASRRVAQAVIEALPAVGIPLRAIVFQLSSGQTRG